MKEQPRYIESDKLIFDLDSYTKVIARCDNKAAVMFQLAGLGVRLSACLIDYLLLVLLAWVFAGALFLSDPAFFEKQGAGKFLALLFFEWNIIYFMFFESFTRGGTPGKRMMGIQVIKKSPDKPFTGITSVVRNLGRIIDFFPFMGILGGALISFGTNRQRFGDYLAGTVVVYSLPLNEQLSKVQVSSQLFSTSIDGYYIEGILDRLRELSAGARIHLSKEVSKYLKTKYGDFSEDAEFAFQQERYIDFLYAVAKHR